MPRTTAEARSVKRSRRSKLKAKRAAERASRERWLLTQPKRWRYLLAFHYKRRTDGDIDGEFLDRLWAAQEGRCCYCEGPMPWDSMSLEHFVPISRGGGNTQDNVGFACWDCNHRKGTMMPDEWDRSRMNGREV